jgi:uncharacterized protein (TIGR02147 family)
MRPNIFEFQSYQKYLESALTAGDKAWGRKSALARRLGCQTSFVSQILAGHTHLSLEHALKVCEFFGHSDDEKSCFLLLLQHGRAGTQELRAYFEEQIDSLKRQRQHVTERLKVDEEITKDDQATYYSSWWYAAIHVATMLPQIKSREDIAELLGLPVQTVSAALDFLISRRLVEEKAGKYKPGKSRVHLGSRSPLISRHHANWRIKAVEVQERNHPKNLHYSGVLAISKKDGERIKSMILDMLQNTEKVIIPSKEERLFVLLVDFFKLANVQNLKSD